MLSGQVECRGLSCLPLTYNGSEGIIRSSCDPMPPIHHVLQARMLDKITPQCTLDTLNL